MSDHQQSLVWETQIIEIEERLRQAMLRSDVAELDALIASELLFTNHFGQIVTKQADLEAHQSGLFKFTEITPFDRHIQLHHEFAVVAVLMHLVGSYDNTPVDQHIRFTRVWKIAATGFWQIVAGHTSAVSPI